MSAPDRDVTLADVARRYCSEHPDQPLTVRPTPRWWTRGQVLAECLRDGHAYNDAHRCAWCGGPIRTRHAYSATYCGGACRVAAFRSRRQLAAGSVTPGTTPAGKSPAADAPEGGPA